MLTTKQWQRYADVMMWALRTARKHRFKKNDIVLLRYDLPARPLAEHLQARLLEMGVHPVMRAVSRTVATVLIVVAVLVVAAVLMAGYRRRCAQGQREGADKAAYH